MFADLKTYRRIFVTGPHRSGTTICARMIAADTGHDLVLEDDFLYANADQLAAFLYAGYGPQVIQCPFLCHEIHDLGWLYGIDMNEVLVVMMHRYREHIIASEEKARLKNGQPVRFDRIGESQKRKYHCDFAGHVSDLRYAAWDDQCKVIPHALDVGYQSLRDHPLWIESRDFSVRQTDPDFEPEARLVLRPLPAGIIDGIRALQNI